MQLFTFHKRIIRFFKLLSLVGIIVVFFSLYNSYIPKINATKFEDLESNSAIEDNASDDGSNNYQAAIENPVFKGLSEALEPYIIKAQKAVKISEYNYSLDMVDASYKLGENNIIVNSQNGILNNLSSLIILKNDVQILFDGLIFNTNVMQIDLINKDVLSNEPVEIFYKNSTIKADSFSSKDNNNIISFKGHVSTKLNISDF